MPGKGTPLLLAALLKPRCVRAFTTVPPASVVPAARTTAGGPKPRAETRNPKIHGQRNRAIHTSPTAPLASSSAAQVESDHRPSQRASTLTYGGRGSEGIGGERPVFMAPKRPQKSWRRKDGNTKKRGRSEHECGGATKEGDGATEQGRETRKIFEGYHPGSYAGELANTLSDDRRRQLQEHQEQEAIKASEEAAASESAENTGSPPPGGEPSPNSKKKIALLIAYNGFNYRGLQINEGATSVEAEVEMALHLAGCISKENFGNLRKVSWSRAARTDKGVHAAAQIISLKLAYTTGQEKETIENINRYLPKWPVNWDARKSSSSVPYSRQGMFKDIRAFDLKRAPKSFDARERCTGRRYEYMMPTYVLAPKEHIADAFAEAEEWEKTHGDRAVEEQPDSSTPVASASRTRYASATEIVGATRAEGGVFVPKDVADEGEGDHLVGCEEQAEMTSAAMCDPPIELSSEAVIQRVAQTLEGYRLPSDRVEKLRDTLNLFLGTKNYHNYTNSKKGGDSSCNRYITSFTSSDPWENEKMEWIRVTVTGQSFLLHQIRKMVAASVDRVRGHSSEASFLTSFSPSTKFNLNIAPSQGLYLERPFYDTHNKHVRGQGSPEKALEWETGPVAEALEEFKKSVIQGGILAKERSDHHLVTWLDRLTRYPCTYEPLGESKAAEIGDADQSEESPK